MRPTKHKQSVLHAPLNLMLGTEVKVRILRQLTLNADPLTPWQLARLVALDVSGVRRVLWKLADTGVLQIFRVRGIRHVRLNAAHPITVGLKALFTSEMERPKKLESEIRDEARKVHALKSVWIEGDHALRKDRLGDPIRIGFLRSDVRSARLPNRATHGTGSSRDADPWYELGQILNRLARKYVVGFTLRQWTETERASLDENGVAPLVGAESVHGPRPVEGTGQLSLSVYLKVERTREKHPLLAIDVTQIAAPYIMRRHSVAA
jgi:hypothetical protein